jgi:hypothetical protein
MDADSFRRIVNLLVPLMNSANERRAVVSAALYGCSVVPQIEWEGAAQVFTTNLVHKLLDYGDCSPGNPALVLLLEGAKARVGTDKAKEFEAIIVILRSAPPPTVPPTGKGSPPPELIECVRGKRELIQMWESSKNSDEKALAMDNLTQAAYDLRQKDFNNKIARARSEIDDCLRGTGSSEADIP